MQADVGVDQAGRQGRALAVDDTGSAVWVSGETVRPSMATVRGL